MSNIEIVIASVPDRDHVVAELWSGDYLFAEIRVEHEDRLVEIYPRKEGTWTLTVNDLVQALKQAEGKLLE